jgi:hypothetical protein
MNDSWPDRIKSMLVSSFDANIHMRPVSENMLSVKTALQLLLLT